MHGIYSCFRTILLLFLCLIVSSTLQAANYNYNIGAQTLGITLGTGQSLTVTVSGPEIRFTLDIGTFSQTGPNTASGSNTSTIAILASTVATSLTVNNTGVFPGTNNVTFSGNSSISTGTLAIDLSGDGVGTVSFTGGFDVSVSTEMSISTNRNISVGSGSQLTAMNAASILFEANQQPTVTSGSFIGISLFGAAVVETTGSGALTLKGRGGDTGNSQRGIQLASASEVNGGTGNVTIEGTGGASTGNFNWGVDVAFNSKITSSGGDIEVTGTGGGSASSGRNYGVSVSRDCEIFAGGTGMVSVEGTGGNTTNTDNYGVYVNAFFDGDFAKITSAGGDVSVKGTGGGSGDSRNNLGVFVHNGGEISAGGMGNVSVEGNGGNSTGSQNDGVELLLNASKITSSGGAVSVKGTGGGGGGIGVSIDRGEITAGGMGQVSVEGNGASIASNSNQNHGVLVNSAPSIISSSGGDVVVKGTAGGNGNSNNNYGVNIFRGGAISAGGMGSVSVEGSGGSATGNGNRGVYILGQGTDPTRIFSSGGEVLITGIEGGGAFGFEVGGDGRVTTVDDGGGITILANSISIGNLANISTQSGHTCAIAPYTSGTAIDLGSFANPLGGPIGLTDAELDRITTGTLIIGDANSGTITVSAAISRPSSTNMELRSGADITFNQEVNTSGGNLLLAPGDAPAAVYPDFSGTDATVNTLSFASDLAIAINGTTPGNGTGSTYSQLAVVGEINLSGVDLILNGSHTPVSGEVFTIVDNDGVEPIMGTFTGLPEGATIPNFLGSGLDATITYMGGDGNDAELTVVVNCDISIANVAVTDETCPGANDGTLTVTATCASCAGGNADIRYSIDNSDFSNTSGVFIDLAPGDYTVYVRDVNDTGCTDSDGPHTIAAGGDSEAPVPDVSVGGGWAEAAKALASDAEGGDRFGYSVSISGDYAIVGAYTEDTGGSDAGAAYIFKRSGTSWAEEAKIQASDAEADDWFGYSVSISGDYAIVGAPFEDTGGSAAGAAYIFKRSGTSWTEEAKIQASDAAGGDQFGWSVSISGDYAIVGAYSEGTGGSNAGAGYIFKRSGTSWTEEAKIQALDAAANDWFGWSVSISGDYAIVGARFESNLAGAAYIFKRSGTSWTEEAKIQASDAEANDQFGFSISISGDYAIVGASLEDTGGSNAGAAYIFKRSGTSWTEEAKIQASDAQADDQFGSSVSISGDYAIVGAYTEDTGGSNAGAAYIFKRSGTSWTEEAKIQASDAEGGDRFGFSVSISGDYAIVGAPFEDAGGNFAGAAYMFELQPGDLPAFTAECSATPPAPTATDNCAGTINGTTTASFPITTQGTTTITWTYDDGNGNITTQEQDIILEDVTNPVAICPTTAPTVVLDGSGNGTLAENALAGGNSTDNCAAAVTETSPMTSFTCADAPSGMVILTATDAAGNMHTASCTVNIDDSNCCDISITNVSVTDEVCPGANDGTLTVTATCGSCDNGNADIRYSIDNINFSNTTGVFTGLAPGTYTVYVQDVNDPSCTDSDGPHTVQMGMEPDAPTLVITDNTCPSPDGVIAAMGCGTGTVAEYATGPDGPWSASPPAYGTTAFTVYARCRDEANGCVSGTDQGTTSPTICPVLSGSIVWENDLSTPVPGATVALTGDDTGDDDTDGMGDYAIPTDGGSSLTLTPAKTGDAYNGVDAADVTRIQQHVTFIDRFDDGYKAIAADVNQSNSVTGLDAAVLFHAINGNPNAAAIFETPSWRFVEAAHTFMDENEPWNPAFPEDISLMNVMADVADQNFVGVKMGDVNGSWVAPLLSGPPMSLMAQDQALKAGARIRVAFRANGLPDVAAWQFALRFDTDYLRFERALPTAAFPLKEENFGAWQADAGELRSVFAVPQGLVLPKDEVIFELEFQVVRGGLRLSEALRLDNSILDGRVYNTALNGGKVALAFKAVETRAVETRSIASLPPAEAALGFALEQNIPNPFGNETLIRFHLPEAGEVVFSVHDVQGRLLYEQQGFLDAGGHEVRLDAARLGATGVLSYTLRTGAHSATRRMVLVR